LAAVTDIEKMSEICFRDEKFEKESGWTHFYQDERFDQRYLDRDGVMFCETLITVRCSLDAAVTLLRGPWTWWDHGRCLEFRLNIDESCDQILKPAAWFWTKIGMHIFPPMALPGTEGLRLPLVLSHHFVGTASFDVYPKREVDDTLIIRGRFHGVENHVPLIPLSMATKRHLRAEAGNFLFPYPRGTGWVGLHRRLEMDHEKNTHQDPTEDWRCEYLQT
jgi:hypothetical protein